MGREETGFRCGEADVCKEVMVAFDEPGNIDVLRKIHSQQGNAIDIDLVRKEMDRLLEQAREEHR